MAKSSWLDSAREALAHAYGRDAASGVVRVNVRNAQGQAVCFVLPFVREDAYLPPMQSAIVQALQEASGPVSSRKLARLSGCSFSTRFSSALRSLRQKGWVRLDPDGYTLEEGR
jgi:hypothetical protein